MIDGSFRVFPKEFSKLINIFYLDKEKNMAVPIFHCLSYSNDV